MSKKTDLVKNTLILAFGKVSTQLVSFFLLPLYTFFLTPAEYGTVDLIITYLVLLVPALTLQLEMASFRFLVDARTDEAYKKRIISSVLQVVFIVLALCAVVFASINWFFALPYALLIFACGAATIFSNLFLQFARGLGDNKKFAIACTVTAATTLAGALAFVVYARMGAEGMLLTLALANILCAIYLFFSLRVFKYISFTASDRSLQKELVGYSLPLVPNGISWWVINASDRTIISIVLGVAANGIYAVSSKYAAIFTSIFGIFSMSWTESASVHINSKDRDVFFSDTINASLRLFGSMALGLIAVVPIIFGVVIAEQFNEAYMYIPILVVGAFFNAIVGMYSAIYIAKKLTKQVMNTSMMAAAVSIILNLVLIQFIGLYAAALSTAIAFLAMAIFRHYDVRKYVRITYNKNLFAILGGLFIVTIALYYTNTFIGNIINIAMVAVAAILLNKSILGVVKDKIFSMRGRKKGLNAEQRVEEEVL